MLLIKSTLVALMAATSGVAEDRQLRAVRTNGFVHAYFINRCSPCANQLLAFYDNRVAA